MTFGNSVLDGVGRRGYCAPVSRSAKKEKDTCRSTSHGAPTLHYLSWCIVFRHSEAAGSLDLLLNAEMPAYLGCILQSLASHPSIHGEKRGILAVVVCGLMEQESASCLVAGENLLTSPPSPPHPWASTAIIIAM